MNFIHFIDESTLKSVLSTGIRIDHCYRGMGILLYPELDIPFRFHGSDPELIEEEQKSNNLTISNKWGIIGALGLKQDGKSVCVVKVDLSRAQWPIKVFIDIHDQVAKKMGELLDELGSHGINYLSEDSLSQVVNRIDSSRFVLDGEFIVNTEKDLKELIKKFKTAGGGLWGAHSFDCMINSNIPATSIVEVLNL